MDSIDVTLDSMLAFPKGGWNEGFFRFSKTNERDEPPENPARRRWFIGQQPRHSPQFLTDSARIPGLPGANGHRTRCDVPRRRPPPPPRQTRIQSP